MIFLKSKWWPHFGRRAWSGIYRRQEIFVAFSPERISPDTRLRYRFLDTYYCMNRYAVDSFLGKFLSASMIYEEGITIFGLPRRTISSSGCRRLELWITSFFARRAHILVEPRQEWRSMAHYINILPSTAAAKEALPWRETVHRVSL